MSDRFRTRCLCATFAISFALHGAPAAAQTPPPAPPVEQPAPPVSRAFTGLFRETATDFRSLASKKPLTALAIGAVMAAAAHTADGSMTATLSRQRAGFLDAGETIGSARMQLASALATFAVGHISGNAKVIDVGGDLVRANIVAQSLTGAVKMSVRRGRPDGTEFSFPSGHTSVTFATATVLQRHFGWKTGIPAYALASYVAASRIHDRRHFLSDVAFGAAVGIVSGWTVTMGRGDTPVTMTPVASPGGGGLAFSW
jgi:membrane-associated phospholipid phosphatase